jgi:hypothetical protein
MTLLKYMKQQIVCDNDDRQNKQKSLFFKETGQKISKSHGIYGYLR